MVKKRFGILLMMLVFACLFTATAEATGVPNETPVVVEQQTETITAEEPTEEKQFGIINANNVILRVGATRDTQEVCRLYLGTKVEVVEGSEVENSDDFGTRIKIIYNGNEGYVAKKYVRIIQDISGEWNLLSTATTQAGANTNRDINISIASGFINEIILKPGEKFNFWNIVGECTYDKGYKDATVYNNGKKSTGIGGGVCQVSTTVNIAAKNAGIATNARQHSLPVSYATREDEATVSFGNQNFTFTNTTGKTIKILMSSGEGACTCEFWELKE